MNDTMRPAMGLALLIGLGMPACAAATTIAFLTDPFAGSNALTTPGRQIVGGELSASFNVTTDIFEFNPVVFGIGSILFANGLVANLPSSGVNVIVLRDLDNDADSTTPFGAGNAANLIADRITSPSAGLFIYFNQNLNLPRLVYSTDLNDNTADLKILARLTNLASSAVLPAFTAANFAIRQVPEPSSLALLGLGLAGLGAMRRKKLAA